MGITNPNTPTTMLSCHASPKSQPETHTQEDEIVQEKDLQSEDDEKEIVQEKDLQSEEESEDEEKEEEDEDDDEKEEEDEDDDEKEEEDNEKEEEDEDDDEKEEEDNEKDGTGALIDFMRSIKKEGDDKIVDEIKKIVDEIEKMKDEIEKVKDEIKKTEDRIVDRVEKITEAAVKKILANPSSNPSSKKDTSASKKDTSASKKDTSASKKDTSEREDVEEFPPNKVLMDSGEILDCVYFGSGSKHPMRMLSNDSTLPLPIALKKTYDKDEKVVYEFPTVEHALMSMRVRNPEVFSKDGILGGDPLKACIAVYGEEKGEQKYQYFVGTYDCFGVVARQAYNDWVAKKGNKDKPYKLHLLDDVDEERHLTIMEKILRRKYTKNADHLSALLNTNDKILIHSSRGSSTKVMHDAKLDNLSGSVCRKTGKLVGENKLGKMLMKIRTELFQGLNAKEGGDKKKKEGDKKKRKTEFQDLNAKEEEDKKKEGGDKKKRKTGEEEDKKMEEGDKKESKKRIGEELENKKESKKQK